MVVHLAAKEMHILLDVSTGNVHHINFVICLTGEVHNIHPSCGLLPPSGQKSKSVALKRLGHFMFNGVIITIITTVLNKESH